MKSLLIRRDIHFNDAKRIAAMMNKVNNKTVKSS
jgi:hypothetical protein